MEKAEYTDQTESMEKAEYTDQAEYTGRILGKVET
jgi:hypothetical protein